MNTPAKQTVYPFAVWDVVEIAKGEPFPYLTKLFQFDVQQTVCITGIHAITEGKPNPANLEFLDHSILSYNMKGYGGTPSNKIPLGFLHTHIEAGMMEPDEYFSRGLRTVKALSAAGMQELRAPEFLIPNLKPTVEILSNSTIIAADRIRVVIFFDGYTPPQPFQLESDRMAHECNIVPPPSKA